MAIYIDDKELVAAHRAGDTEAFEELVREYRGPLFNHARRKLRCEAGAEDAVQETLVRAYRALPKFDGEYRLGPWLHRIMANVCVDEANRRKRDGIKTDNFAAQPSVRSDAPSVEEELGLELGDPRLDAALGSLSDPHREALELRFVEDLGYERVAEISGVSEQNARARVSRAKTAMRAALRGVAALPLLLAGLLKRGEKAAAAATSTSGALAASGGSATLGVTSAAAQTAPVVLPTLAEASLAASQAAPSVMPIVAKAAVGIGLAAAVLTPTSDSAVHQAVENLATGTAGVVVEEISLDSGDETAATETSAAVSNSTVDTDSGFAPIETQTPIEISSPPVQPATNDERAAAQVSSAVAPITDGLGALIESDDLILSRSGGDRYSLSGSLAVTVAGTRSVGQVTGASWIRIDGEADVDGRRRIDGFVELESETSQMLGLRIAGFGREESGNLEMGGLFRADANSLRLTQSGSFSGTLALGDTPGLTVLTFNP
ncbi:MAG: RNA polymerase sigma factor [Actinomycetota bacterium]|nr:RNA polymerase sigma factor [Actinomycetota bacterium]